MFGILKLEKASTPNASVIECCFEIELGDHKYHYCGVLNYFISLGVIAFLGQFVLRKFDLINIYRCPFDERDKN